MRDEIETVVESKKSQLDHKLYERFSAFWVAVSDQIRLARNDAGHPISVDPVTHEIVHGALLLFPEFARLVVDLDSWINSTMT